MSDDTREKMSNTHKKRYENPEIRKEQSEKLKRRYLDHPEVREKISESLRKRFEDDENRKKISRKLKGRVFTEDHLHKLHLVARRGKKSNLWRGGTRINSPYPPEYSRYLRHRIRKKFEYICQVCENHLEKFDAIVHHMDGNKNNNIDENFTLLCRRCHGQVHRDYRSDNSKILKLQLILHPEWD